MDPRLIGRAPKAAPAAPRTHVSPFASTDITVAKAVLAGHLTASNPKASKLARPQIDPFHASLEKALGGNDQESEEVYFESSVMD